MNIWLLSQLGHTMPIDNKFLFKGEAGSYCEIIFSDTKWACSAHGKRDHVLYKTRHSKDMWSVWIYTHILLIHQQGDIRLDAK